MGINVSVIRSDGSEHPDWDFGRHAGDRDIPRVLESVGSIVMPTSRGEHDPVLRPTEPRALEALMMLVEPDNAARWRQLRELLEEDPGAGLYYSW